MGAVEGGKRGDLFMYRTFFDLEVTRPGRGRHAARRVGQALRQAQPTAHVCCAQIKAENGALLHQVRNRQDAKFDFIMSQPVRPRGALRVAPARLTLRTRGGSRRAYATTAATTRRRAPLRAARPPRSAWPRQLPSARPCGWSRRCRCMRASPLRSPERMAPPQVVYQSHVGHKVDHGKVTAGALAGARRRAFPRGHTATHPDLRLLAAPRRADQLQPVRDTVRDLRSVLRQLLDEQAYQAKRDSTHLASACALLRGLGRAQPRADAAPRAANESTGRRAVFYACLEAGGLVVVSLAQVRRTRRPASRLLPSSVL